MSQPDDQLLEGLDGAEHLQGPLDGGGQPVGAAAEAIVFRRVWVDHCRAHLRAAGKYRWPAKLGLPVYLDPGCIFYGIFSYPAGLYEGGRFVYELGGAVVQEDQGR